jgi:predicted transcriptional regulator of viral defense system
VLIGATRADTFQRMMRSFQESQAGLFAVAEAQGGFFTAKQAEAAGFDRTNHAYHVRSGKWMREYRGIYRLKQYPLPPDSDLILWSLWSRGRDDVPQGVYSHETALRIFDLSDNMPAKLHMTVPVKFRRGAAIPAVLVLHRADLALADVEEREGFRVTRPMRTILDLVAAGSLSSDLLKQALDEARNRGLITSREAQSDKLPAWLTSEKKGER